MTKEEFLQQAVIDEAWTDFILSLINSSRPAPTGTPDGTKYLRDDNTWSPVTGGSGLTFPQVLAISSLRL